MFYFEHYLSSAGLRSLERAVILCQGDTLQPQNLSMDRRAASPSGPEALPTLEEGERRLILRVPDHHARHLKSRDHLFILHKTSVRAKFRKGNRLTSPAFAV